MASRRAADKQQLAPYWFTNGRLWEGLMVAETSLFARMDWALCGTAAILISWVMIISWFQPGEKTANWHFLQLRSIYIESLEFIRFSKDDSCSVCLTSFTTYRRFHRSILKEVQRNLGCYLYRRQNNVKLLNFITKIILGISAFIVGLCVGLISIILFSWFYPIVLEADQQF